MKVHHRRTSSQLIWRTAKQNYQRVKIPKQPQQNRQFLKFIQASNQADQKKNINVQCLNPSFHRQSSLFLFGRNRQRLHSEQPIGILETIRQCRSVPKLTFKTANNSSLTLLSKPRQRKKKLPDFGNQSMRSPYIQEIEKNQLKTIKKNRTHQRKQKNKDFFSKTFLKVRAEKIKKSA